MNSSKGIDPVDVDDHIAQVDADGSKHHHHDQHDDHHRDPQHEEEQMRIEVKIEETQEMTVTHQNEDDTVESSNQEACITTSLSLKYEPLAAGSDKSSSQLTDPTVISESNMSTIERSISPSDVTNSSQQMIHSTIVRLDQIADQMASSLPAEAVSTESQLASQSNTSVLLKNPDPEDQKQVCSYTSHSLSLY